MKTVKTKPSTKKATKTAATSRTQKPTTRTGKSKPAPRAKAPRAPVKPAASAESGLRPGEAAPKFSLPSDAGSERSLADWKGRWVVLYFYPRDNTPGCTREALAFRDTSREFEKRGAVVVGVSRDSIASHCKFRDQHGLNFTLLSDPSTKTHADYGAFGEKVFYGKKIIGALRTTVIIRPDGRVGRVFRSVKVDGHDRAVLDALDELAEAAG